MDTLHLNAPQVKMVAHRGMSGLELENTCSAFVAAGNRSYYGIETDVHRTSDGHFIIIHDDNTKRVAQDEMIVENACSRDPPGHSSVRQGRQEGPQGSAHALPAGVRPNLQAKSTTRPACWS